MTTNSTWATLRKSAFRKLWGAAVISATCVLAHEDGRFRAFPQLGSLLSTVVALPFLLFTLSADTLTQSVDVSKLTWATDVYMAAAGAWDFIAIDTISSKVYRFAASDQRYFLCGTCRRTEDVSPVAYSTRSGGTHNE